MHKKSTAFDKKNTRDFGADIVRITALFMVLWLHFYLRNGFYYTEITDLSGFIAVMFRPILMCCVPLFMILTGYLKCSKKWDLRYYRSLFPILVSYLLISLIHLPYKIFFQDQHASIGEWILQILRFDLANYSWYVGMYIGLFLLSPLLNLIWNACTNRKAHLAIVLTFVALTFLPATVNDTELGNLIPAYFQSVYYATYYIIGCYIRTYKPKIPKWICVLLIVSSAAVLAWVNITTRSEAANYYSGFSTGYNGLIEGLMTTTCFLFLYSFSTGKEKIRKAAAHVSGIVLELYLLSYIIDTKIYVMFYKQYSMNLYLPVGFLMVLAVFILSYPFALCVNRISKRIVSWAFGGRDSSSMSDVPKEHQR